MPLPPLRGKVGMGGKRSRWCRSQLSTPTPALPIKGLTITHNFRALRERPKVQGVDNKKGAADNQL
jgi:hypothetical protein